MECQRLQHFSSYFRVWNLREINVDFVCSHLIEPDFTLNSRELDLQKDLITLVVIPMVVH